MEQNNIAAKMTELIKPIDEAIMMCDSREDVLNDGIGNDDQVKIYI
jgi:hypothetical protein